MLEISAGISSLTASIGLARAIINAKSDLGEADLKTKMAELLSGLADAKIALADAREVIHAKDKEIAELAEKLEFVGELIDVSGFKYDNVAGQPKGLPYCPTCSVSEGKYYRLQKGNEDNSRCANCGVVYNAAANGRVNQRTNYEPPEPRGDGW